MLTEFFKFFIYLNIILSISILIFVIISRAREPKKFPDNFSKKYIIKPRIKFKKI